MKRTKWALLASAAMTVMAVSAKAEDAAALKAQIEALQQNVSQLEAQQGALPEGYDLMAIRKGQGTFEGVAPERNADKVREDSGFTISVLPRADAEPVAEISVSGEIRSGLIYSDRGKNRDSLDATTRGRVVVKGKVDTSVGEVGGYVRLQDTGGSSLTD